MVTKKISSKKFFKRFGHVTFAELLKSFRLYDDLTQAEFARKLGISPANLCDLEKGRKIPSPKRAARIAKKLGLPEAMVIQLAIQADLVRAKLDYKVSVAA